MGNSKILFKGILFSGVAFLINYLITFFLTPFITNNIGTDAYGYVTLAKTFASYALILMTALNSYSSRFIAVEYHKGNVSKANRYFNSVFFSNLIVSIVIFLIVSININTIQNVINTPEEISRDVSVLFILVFGNFIITTTGTAYQAAAYIKNKIDLMNIFRGLSYITEAAVLFSLYRIFRPFVYYVGIGLCISSFVLVVGNVYISKKYIPEFVINFKEFNIAYVKELIVNGIWNSFNSLGNTLNSGLDLLICSIMLSPISMGQLSIAKSIVSIFTGIFQMASTPFHPLFLKSYANKDIEKLKIELDFSMKISGLISNLAFAGFLSLGFIYYKLWIPSQDIELIYNLTIVSILASVLEGAMFPLYYIYTLTVKNKVPCIITIIGGLLNVMGMFVLIKCTSLGVYAVVLTTAVIMSVINGITNPIYMANCLEIKPSFFFRNILKHLFSCVIMSVLFVFVGKILNPSGWVPLIGCGIIEVIFGVIIHYVVCFGLKSPKSVLQQL